MGADRAHLPVDHHDEIGNPPRQRRSNEGDIMKRSRHKSLQMKMHYNQGNWWTRNAAGNILV